MRPLFPSLGLRSRIVSALAAGGGDGGSIISAEVEANGWVLAITATGTLTSPNTNFGAYPLDPDGLPKLLLSVSSPGFAKSGGQAVASSTSRVLVATRPLRLPVDPLNPNLQVLDETDVGGGNIKVRLALSEEVYVGDTGLSLSALGGWRTSAPSASGVTVVNNSTLAPPVPVMRWVLPPYETTSGSFRVSLIVGTVNPVGFEPVAAVKFTATDGTTVKTVWVDTLDTDNTYGDNLRCYTAIIDPTTATALTAGLLRIDAEVYPWVGAMRTTDTAGTKSMTNIRTDGLSRSAESPWVIGYDPAGTRYGQQWLYVDPTNGTATPAASMVATSLAAAKAIAPASRPRDVSTAVQALYLQNRTLAAANGQVSDIRAMDGARIVMAPGTHTGFGTTTVTNSPRVNEIPVRIIGDPDDSNPRVNCIINTGGNAAVARMGRARYQNLTVQTASTFALTDASTAWLWLDNVTVQGASGFETSATWPLQTGAAQAGLLNVWAVQSRVWRLGTTIHNANRWPCLFRSCEFSRRVAGVCFVKNRWISKTEDNFNASNTTEGYGTVTTSSMPAQEDIVVAYNDHRAMRWGVFAFTATSAAESGVSPQVGIHRRYLILNNVFERISGTNGVSTTSDTFWNWGEASYVIMDNIIVEGNTVVGGGYNAFYSDPSPATIADVNTQTNITRRIRHANNATDRNASKQDDFSDPNTLAVRNAAGGAEPAKAGYRPACIGAWSVHFGVGMEAHVDYSRKGTAANFRRDGGSGFVGLRGLQSPAASPGVPAWTNDRSEAGNDLGLGDYRPTASSPVLGRVRRGNSDRDWLGNPRQMNGASGAIEL